MSVWHIEYGYTKFSTLIKYIDVHIHKST